MILKIFEILKMIYIGKDKVNTSKKLDKLLSCLCELIVHINYICIIYYNGSVHF